MSYTKTFAKLNDSTERIDREVNLAIDVSQIGQLDPDGFVHRCKMECSVRVDSVLVQRVFRPGEPVVASGPPERVVRPVLFEFFTEALSQF